MTFLDTQILSYAVKGEEAPSIAGQNIASVVANEFLLVQTDDPQRASYYLPHSSRVNRVTLKTGLEYGSSRGSLRKPQHPFGKNSTDQLIMEFGIYHPPIIEYGNFAIADAINQRLDLLVAAAIGFLPKDQIKSIRARFGFLVRNNIQCVPLNRNDIEVAFWLLHEFLGSYNPKQNF